MGMNAIVGMSMFAVGIMFMAMAAYQSIKEEERTAARINATAQSIMLGHSFVEQCRKDFAIMAKH